MEVFKYSKFYEIVYKYGNIPVSLILFFYFILSLLNITKGIGFILAALITGLMLFFLNKRYIENYKILPYKITADEEKLTCSNFMIRDKIVEIYFKDITSISGGIFDKKYSGIIRIHDNNKNEIVGFYNRIKNSKMLYTILLSRINLKLYEEVITKLGFTKEQFIKNK